MIQERLANIQKQHIERLFSEPTREDRTTEYKSQLSHDSNALMKAVSSFANSIGGDLIFGINAKDGTPTSAPALDRNLIDKEILRLMQLSRSALQPPLPLREIDFKEVPWDGERSILIVRVPQSWARPHQVKANNMFYGRSAAGAYPLDVSELRELFAMSEQFPARANKFVEEQLSKVQDAQRPVQMTKHIALHGKGWHMATKMVFHLIPVSAFSGGTRIDIRSIAPQLDQNLHPLGVYIGNEAAEVRKVASRLNLDGYVAYERDQTRSYVQLFRNGILEAVQAPDEEIGTRNVVVTDYEVRLSRALPNYAKLLSKLEIEPPFFLHLSLVNVRDWYLRGAFTSKFAFETDILRVPEIMVSEGEFDTDLALLQLFNMIWQAVGEEKSPREKDGKIVPL